jgi:hypothetical protein
LLVWEVPHYPAYYFDPDDDQQQRRVGALLFDASASHGTHSAAEIEIARASSGEQSVIPSTWEVQQVAGPLVDP